MISPRFSARLSFRALAGFLVVSCLGLSSCALTKSVNKKDKDTTEKEEITSQTKREGDTVTYFVPKLVLKDTTIYTVNRVGTRIETRYNDQGQIDRIDCMSSAIEELTRIIREKETNESEKDKDEEFKMDTTFVIVAGIVFLIIFAGVFMYFAAQISSIKKTILP